MVDVKEGTDFKSLWDVAESEEMYCSLKISHLWAVAILLMCIVVLKKQKISHLWGEAWRVDVEAVADFTFATYGIDTWNILYVGDFAFVRWGTGRAGRCCLTALLTVDPITTGSIQFPGNLAVLLWDEPPPPHHHHPPPNPSTSSPQVATYGILIVLLWW